MCVGVNDDSSDGATVGACVSGVVEERRHAAGEGQCCYREPGDGG
jgi:hypothetical protein